MQLAVVNPIHHCDIVAAAVVVVVVGSDENYYQTLEIHYCSPNKTTEKAV